MDYKYQFKNDSLQKKAFTHTSFAHDTGIESNQRLEFLGDSILSFVVANYIYQNHRKMDEGKLTETRAALVCEKTLASAARRMGLGECLQLGKSEECSGGREKDSILADTFEALLAAIYLDSDIETAREWTLDVLKYELENFSDVDCKNYKSDLQTYFQKRDKGMDVVQYVMKEKSGPDHNPSFKVEAVYRRKVIGKGAGKNRKLAEQNAAKDAFERMK